MSTRRVFTVATMALNVLVAFLVAAALGWILPFPWGFIAGVIAAAGTGWWAGRILYRVRAIERREDRP